MPRRSQRSSEDVGFASNPLGDDRPIPLCPGRCGNESDLRHPDGLCPDCSGGECADCGAICPVDAQRCADCIKHEEAPSA